MKRLLLAAVLAFAAPAADAEEARLVTVVTSPDAQTQLMAMVLTMQALEQGTPTRVLLCGPGGDLGLADPPASATAPQPPRGASPQGLLRAIIEHGAARRRRRGGTRRSGAPHRLEPLSDRGRGGRHEA